MADNSLQSILDWMINPDSQVMWGWDAIAAMDRSKINTLMLQEYVAHITRDAYLPLADGEVEVAQGQKECIHDFLLDVPRLSFENADFDNSMAKLTCFIMRGTHVTMKLDASGWLAEKIVEIDPLQGPELSLDLKLADVGGVVENEGQIYLDLAHSDNFRLTFAPTDHEQLLGGYLFKDLFNQLSPEQRIWKLGNIQKGANESLRPRLFRLCTQASGVEARDQRSPLYGEGAVLVLICMEGGTEGGSISSTYKYLIPDDAGQHYSATVLFSLDRMDKAVPLMDYVVGLVAQLMDKRDFTYVHDAGGRLIKATVRSGALRIPESLTSLLPLPVQGRNIAIEIHQAAVEFSGVTPEVMQLTRENDGRVSISWRSEAQETTTIRFPDSEFQPVVQRALCSINIYGHYAFGEGGRNDLVLLPHLTIRIDRDTIDDSSSQSAAGDWLLVIAYVTAQLAIMSRAVIEPKIRGFLDKSLGVQTSLGTFIRDCIQLTFGKAIEGDVIRAPRDIGFFGRINSSQTGFQITPLHPMMLAGAQQQFATEPPLDGLTWRLSAVQGETSPSLGRMISAGLYEAPAATSIGIHRRFMRVRLTASRDGFSSSALITILVNRLTVNPLIQLCPPGHSVELAAAALGGDDLRWAIKNPGPGSGRVERSELLEGDYRYVAGPPAPDSIYVLDEIEVSDSIGAKRSAWVLVRQSAVGLTVKPLSESLPMGQLRLQASLNGNPVPAQWSLPMGGPGTISNDGLYRSSPAAIPDLFVLVFAVLNDEQYGKFEGHIVLPLPLSNFSGELELMRA
jgi:hypothetical protein